MSKTPLPRKTTVPKSLEHWFLNPEHCIRLREILDDEVFQVAVATLKESAAPSAASISTDPQQNSHRLSWFAGYRDAFIDLAKLTKAPAKTTNTNDEWMHLLNQ
jgi:hypothetical protein